MDEKNQIEEMARAMCDRETTCKECPVYICRARIHAANAYKAGFRKQSENVVELPCKPGQTLWFPSEYYGRPYPINVTHLEIYEEEIVIYSEGGSEWRGEDIGKTIFLTKEESEQALAKMKGGAG